MMRSSVVVLSILFVAALPLPGAARAQDMMSSERASQFDFAVRAGAAYTTPWFRGPRGDGEVGLGPAAGAHATFWITPALGVRAGGAYAGGSVEGANEGSPLRLHLALYDAGVVLRPFFSFEGTLRSNAYLYAGAGGISAFSSAEGVRCAEPLVPRGVCLPTSAADATAGQGVVAIGTDLAPLGSGAKLFAEAAAHGYDAPLRPGQPDAEDRFAVTGTLTVGVKLLVGDILPPPPVIMPPPPPLIILPPPPPSPSPTPPAPPGPVTPYPTAGGYVQVITTPPGAHVYLVPEPLAGIKQAEICRLKPNIQLRAPYMGPTSSTNLLRFYAPLNTYFVVVRQDTRVYLERVKPANYSTRKLSYNTSTEPPRMRCPAPGAGGGR
jgi:hypothetical protein